MNIKQTIRNRVNRVLAPIGRTFHEKIPLNDIFQACTNVGLQPLQEDGTPWSGILCGDNGRTTFDLAFIERERPGYHTSTPVQNAVLVLEWHRMSSGTYEINTYLS